MFDLRFLLLWVLIGFCYAIYMASAIRPSASPIYYFFIFALVIPFWPGPLTFEALEKIVRGGGIFWIVMAVIGLFCGTGMIVVARLILWNIKYM